MDRNKVTSTLQQRPPAFAVSTRPGPGGKPVPYLAGEAAVDLANLTFGYDGWSNEMKDMSLDWLEEKKPGLWSCGVTVVMKVTLTTGGAREDVGCWSCECKTKGEALELARKGAVTDALKRCLRLFGHRLGNGLKAPAPPTQPKRQRLSSQDWVECYIPDDILRAL